jgi:hypothetical protein
MTVRQGRLAFSIEQKDIILRLHEHNDALTGTPFARMRMPEKWDDYARLMDGFMSLTDIVATGIGISRHTARPARYRGGKTVLPGLSGELIPVLTAVDRAYGVVEAILPDRSGIVAALDGRIAEGSVRCSDGLKGYVAAAVKHRSEHRRIMPPRKDWLTKAVGGKPRREGRHGLGRVNCHHERLKTFINRQLRGVGTKYLPNYLGWARAMRRTGFAPPILLQQAVAA